MKAFLCNKCAQSLSCVRFFATPWTVTQQVPLSMGVRARMLEWGAISCSGGSSQLRDQTYVSCVSCIGRSSLPGVGSRSLLQGIFPTQGSNLDLPHCRRILYWLSHKGSPVVFKKIPYISDIIQYLSFSV